MKARLAGPVLHILLTGAGVLAADGRTPPSLTSVPGAWLSRSSTLNFHDASPRPGGAFPTTAHDDFHDRFASEHSRSRYRADPGRGEPACDGWCAPAMLEGDKADVDPAAFRIIAGRSCFFGNDLGGNAVKRWSTRAGRAVESGAVRGRLGRCARRKIGPVRSCVCGPPPNGVSAREPCPSQAWPPARPAPTRRPSWPAE